MKKDFNFTTAFAMRCDAEQFESVRKEMEAMGYQKMYDYNSGYLCTNYNQENCLFGLAPKNDYFQKLSLETFNRDLCLALAAMTNKEDGIAGEWFKGTDNVREFFTCDKLYQKEQSSSMIFTSFISDTGRNHDLDDEHLRKWFRKATADELIKYFTESKTEQKQPETDPQIEALQKRIEDLERNVKQLAESMQKVKESEPQPASRFADKQPIWAWDDGDAMFRRVGFWDAKNHYMFTCDGKRSGYLYDNYESIPADQIPAWMVEAAKHLED